MLERIAQRGKGLLERLERHARVRMAVFLLLLALIGGMMVLLNAHTPLQMDDYDYSFSWSTGKPVTGILDVLASQAAHYKLWGGRSVVHTFAQLFLSMDKAVFNLANALMYLLLLLEVYALARPKGRSWCWTILLCAHAALFTGVPFFGTVFLWLTGSCNYLWGTVLALTPLLIDKNAQEEGFFAKTWHGWIALPVCFFAGWTNENTACGVLALMMLMQAGRVIQKKQVAHWQWATLAAQAAGTAVMLLAPGNFSRASSYETGSVVVELLRRAVSATVYGGVYVGALLIAVLLLWALCGALSVRRRTGWTLLLLFGGAAGAYSMVASPVFSDRSWTGVIVLALIAVLTLLGDLEAQTREFDAAKMLMLPLCLLLVAYGGYQAYGDVCAHEEKWLSQVAVMEMAAREGAQSVKIEGVESGSRFTMDIQVEADASQWPNSTLGKAFGVSVNGL